MPKRRFALLSTVVLAAGALFAPLASAFAAGGGGVITPDAPVCDAGWVYHVTSNTANNMVVYQRYAVINQTGATATGSFTSATSGTLTVGASISLSAEMKAAIFGGIKTQVSTAISTTTTAETGVTATAPVKPYSTLHGDWGIWKENTTGDIYYMYSNCAIVNRSNGITGYAPKYAAWRLYY